MLKHQTWNYEKKKQLERTTNQQFKQPRKGMNKLRIIRVGYHNFSVSQMTYHYKILEHGRIKFTNNLKRKKDRKGNKQNK